ncbi:hypothetical protein [Rubellimicrobium arenae]|uniref:hypothetical protein n=1 Tax=Rubellimicrobium arenae TaxID=2817372 RepID=UPI001B30B96D|nr:hypothetical protein [Rubellimicrobium arenae]
MSQHPPSPSSDDIVQALLALATREHLGEGVTWAEVEAAINQLVDRPRAARLLREALERLDNPKTALNIADWLDQAARSREADARAAGRSGEKFLAPLQGVSLGALATSGFAYAAGTLDGIVSACVGSAAFLLAGASTTGRWMLSRREDLARQDAEALRRLAEIAQSREA